VQLPDGSAFDYLVILFENPERAGEYLGSIDVPRQLIRAQALVDLEFVPGRSVRFGVDRPGDPHWQAEVRDNEVHCEFTQSGNRRQCTLSGSGFPPPTANGSSPSP
jgi:hypothetical protein